MKLDAVNCRKLYPYNVVRSYAMKRRPLQHFAATSAMLLIGAAVWVFALNFRAGSLSFGFGMLPFALYQGRGRGRMSAASGSSQGCRLFRQTSCAFGRFWIALAVLLGSITLHGAGSDPLSVEASRPQGSQLTPAAQSIAQLNAANALLKAGQFATAKGEFAKVINLPDAPAHHVWEARQRIEEIERRETGLPARDTNATRVRLPLVPRAGLTLHISPHGNDANPGTLEKPLASLEAARDRLRSLRRSGSVTRGSLVVFVHDGEYRIEQTLALSSEDSGTEETPVVYQAAPGETPRLCGGVRLRGFKSVTAPEILKRLPKGMAGRIKELDLRAAGITNLLPLELGGFASGRGFKTHPAHELFFNGKAMRLARGPNEGYLRIADVAMKDGTKGYDREGSKVGKFYYPGDLPERWAAEPDLLLYGYWFWDWADSYERVMSIDTQKRLITLAEPWHKYGYSIGAPFYAVNALSELDVSGEYYMDRQNLRLFFYPPSDPENADVELSVLPNPMMTLENVSYVRFERLTWELGCNDAIHVNGGSNCVFAGCIVRNFAGTGIELNGGRQHGLLSCNIYSMGRGGAVVRGGDRKTLAPSGHFVENCDIHELSRIDHTYTPAIAMSGVGTRITHNRLHDVLSSALNIGGNDHIIEYNEVFNAVSESDDQGGVDMYGNPTFRGNVYRFNYWHHIGNWRAIGEQPKCGQAGIRLDDAISGTLVYGNVFERCSTGKDGFGGVQIHGGKDNIIDNNLFIDCAAALSFSPWEDKRWRNFVAPFMTNSEINTVLYLQRYPALASLAENVNTNAVYRSLLVRCGELLRHPPNTIEALHNTMLSDSDISLGPENLLIKLPDLAPIPVGEIGLYRDAFRSEIPRPGFSPSRHDQPIK